MVNDEVKTTDNVVETVETVETTNTTEIEALKAQLQEKEEKINSLGDKIYRLKKENKEKEKVDEPTVPTVSETDIEKIIEERDFFKNNPDLVAYKDEIKNFTSKDLSLEDAKTLILKKDPTILNRQKTNLMNMTNQGSGDSLVFTESQLEKLSDAEYSKAKDLINSGKATFVRD